jgi:2-oxoglutarate dehydrogenase E2 component (dihydrolipoamide succinyltransferase)
MVDILAPSPGESVTEVTIQTWYVKSGDYVQREQRLADIETDKAVLELYAESAGVIQIIVTEGTTVEINTLIARIDTSAAAPADSPATVTPVATAPTPTAPPPATNTDKATNANNAYAKGVPSVSAQKMMDEKGLSSAQIEGTGRDGRITKADVIQQGAHLTAPNQTTTPPASPTIAPVAVNPLARNERREKMSKLRQTLAARLVSVKNETAMLTTFNEVDLTAIQQIRAKYKDKFKEKYGIGLGFMSFFTRACCEALKDFPAVNAFIDGDELIYHDYVDMGIAVSTDRGLMVPVVRNAESLSLAQIETQIAELAGKARNNKISISEMTGGTFTITNGGVFGSLMSTPILNPPQSGILGMHKIQDRPMVIDGKVEIRPMMYLALSYDHRVIDGKESVSFLVRVKDLLEDPSRMLLGI